MNIKVFIHATDITGEIYITLEQLDLLKSVGLLGEAQEVLLCTHYDKNSYTNLKGDMSHYHNVKFKHFDDNYKEWYEYTTCLELQNHSKSEDFYALYIHNKGAFTRTIGNYNWRKYMQYFCIEKWEECVKKLDEGYELVGAAYLDNSKKYDANEQHYFAGNFFWAKSSYIRRCQQLKEPPEVLFNPQMKGQPHLRYDLEPWHASGNPKWFEMHEGKHERWYLPPETYRQDIQYTFVYRTN